MYRALAITLAMAALPGVAAAQKTTYDFDKTAPFAQFKTYAMKEGTPTKNALIDNRLVSEIETQMAAKGFTKNETNPDVFVVFHVAFDEQKDISSYSTGPMYGGYGYGWGGGWGSTTTDVRVRDILVGTLPIRSKWRGAASALARSTPTRSRKSATRTSRRRSRKSSSSTHPR
jgi:hypothetical protein